MKYKCRVMMVFALMASSIPASAIMNGAGQDIFPVTAVFNSSASVMGGPGLLVNYGIKAGSATLTGGITASSGTFTQTGGALYSLQTSSGINVQTGGVTAPFFAGNGSALTGLTFTGANTFTSTTSFTAQNASLPSVSISSGLVVSNGGVGIGTGNPAVALDVTGAAHFKSHANLPNDNGVLVGAGAKATTSGGGQLGVIGIFSNDVAATQLQGTIGLVTDATVANRRLAISVIEQGTGYKNITLAEGGGNVGVGTPNPAATLDVGGTSAIKIPVGTTAQRPVSPVTGSLRYNSTLSKIEFYNGTAWRTAYNITDSDFGGGGGTITQVGGYRIHTFTTSGVFTVTGSGAVDILVVGGGGGGGGYPYAGGGGAGGMVVSNTVSITAGSYNVVVGLGGAGGASGEHKGVQGGDSIFFGLTAGGGGGGGSGNNATEHPTAGRTSNGNGGGESGYFTAMGAAGDGTGHGGGAGGTYEGGGGGGAGAVGGNGSGTNGGAGGIGMTNSFSGSLLYYSGGGGGGAYGSTPGVGGVGGLGGGGAGAAYVGGTTVNGTINTGGGGGGGSGTSPTVGGSGGSGIVIIRYPN